MKGLKAFLIIFLPVTVVFFLPVLFTASSITGNYGDVYMHYYPLKHLATEQLIKGEMPLWNPYIYAGQPLMANPQSALFYPLGMLFYLLPLPVAFNYFTVLHFFMAGLFTFLFLSRYGFTRSASFLGSAALSFSSFLVYQVPAGHPAALSGFVWLPLTALILTELTKELKIFPVFLLGLVCTLQFLSGHPFPFFISLVYILIHAVSCRLLYWKHLLSAFGVFVGLSALQLIPSMELSQLTETANWPSLVKSYSLAVDNLATIILPGAFGSVVKGDFVFQKSPSFFFEKFDLYFGVLPLLLSMAGVAIALRTRRYFFLLLLAAGLFLSFGFSTSLYRFLYEYLPGLDYLRVPARFYFLSLLSLIVLACIAWDVLIKQRSVFIKIALASFVVVDLFLWHRPFIYAENMSAYRTKNEISRYLSPLYRMITEPDRLAPNKAMLYHHYNLNGYEAILLMDFTRYLGLQEKRVFNATGLARADLTSPLARGFSTGYYLGSTRISGTVPLADAAPGVTLYRYDTAVPRVYIARTAKVIAGDEVYEQMDYLRKTTHSPDDEILLTQIPEWFSGASGNSTMLSFRSAAQKLRAEITLDAPGIVVFSELYYPGWKGYADGREYPLVRGNKVFRTVVLPAGKYTGDAAVTLVYQPTSWRFGLVITLLSLLALGAYALLKERERNALDSACRV